MHSRKEQIEMDLVQKLELKLKDNTISPYARQMIARQMFDEMMKSKDLLKEYLDE
jgi:hypothetical protein